MSCHRPLCSAHEALTSPALPMARRALGGLAPPWVGTHWKSGAAQPSRPALLHTEWLTQPPPRAAGDRRIKPKPASPWADHPPAPGAPQALLCPHHQTRRCLATHACLATNCLTALAGGSQLECPNDLPQAAGAILSFSVGRCDGSQAVSGPWGQRAGNGPCPYH